MSEKNKKRVYKVMDTLVELVGDKMIEDLPFPYTAVAADIVREKEVWIRSGKLFDAIRASISIPLFFTPFHRKGVDLIDGGVLNPVPIAPTFGDDTEMTIAVNVGGPAETQKPRKELPAPPEEQSLEWHEKIARYIGDFQKSVKKNTGMDWSVYDIASQAFDAMQGTIARQKLAAYPPDSVIEISRSSCGILEFDRAAEMIDLGYANAGKNMAHLRFE